MSEAFTAKQNVDQALEALRIGLGPYVAERSHSVIAVCAKIELPSKTESANAAETMMRWIRQSVALMKLSDTTVDDAPFDCIGAKGINRRSAVR